MTTGGVVTTGGTVIIVAGGVVVVPTVVACPWDTVVWLEVVGVVGTVTVGGVITGLDAVFVVAGVDATELIVEDGVSIVGIGSVGGTEVDVKYQYKSAMPTVPAKASPM